MWFDSALAGRHWSAVPQAMTLHVNANILDPLIIRTCNFAEFNRPSKACNLALIKFTSLVFGDFIAIGTFLP